MSRNGAAPGQCIPSLLGRGFVCLVSDLAGRDYSSCTTAAIWRSIAKRLSSRNGQGASELLRHVIAREAGWLAVDRRRDIVALFLVEAWRFNAERRQRDPSAAASSALFFRYRQYAAANPCAAPIFWQKEPGDIDESEFGPSV